MLQESSKGTAAVDWGGGVEGSRSQACKRRTGKGGQVEVGGQARFCVFPYFVRGPGGRGLLRLEDSQIASRSGGEGGGKGRYVCVLCGFGVDWREGRSRSGVGHHSPVEMDCGKRAVSPRTLVSRADVRPGTSTKR